MKTHGKKKEATPSFWKFPLKDFRHNKGEAIKFNPNPKLNSALMVHL